ncbi:MAG: hypothetical protein BWX84_02478 [Verrucomicrobia bacterium ADurb.Bin118]|nr:MAG: hypothetical protein BWX84_02478 [Verrucomicrobia bacterium ADurb.Bin118]
MRFAFWKTNPKCCRRNARRFTKARAPSITGSPPITMRPEVGGLIKPMAVRKVDLPAPLGPSSATTSPRASCMDTLFMATTSVLPAP